MRFFGSIRKFCNFPLEETLPIYGIVGGKIWSCERENAKRSESPSEAEHTKVYPVLVVRSGKQGVSSFSAQSVVLVPFS